MFPRLCILVAIALAVTARPLAQRDLAAMHYAGTVGQQRVNLTLDIASDAVTSGHYRYAGQKNNIRFVNSRQFGTTVVLQDEDGNILHLHFEDARGEKAGSFKTAAMLEGTLDRAELDLPVKLTRIEGKQ